jgi:hypothetical protein
MNVHSCVRPAKSVTTAHEGTGFRDGCHRYDPLAYQVDCGAATRRWALTSFFCRFCTDRRRNLGAVHRRPRVWRARSLPRIRCGSSLKLDNFNARSRGVDFSNEVRLPIGFRCLATPRTPPVRRTADSIGRRNTPICEVFYVWSKYELVEKQARFWVLMARGSTLTAACDAVGVNRRTGRRWRQAREGGSLFRRQRSLGGTCAWKNGFELRTCTSMAPACGPSLP